MKDLTSFIRSANTSNSLSTKDLIATTVRLPSNTSDFISDFAEQIGITKQEFILRLIEEGLRIAEIALNEDKESEENGNFHIVNTIKRYGIWYQNYMIENQVVAAFDDNKSEIKRLKKNDLIFLYSNGDGVIAYGNASGNTIVHTEMNGLYQKLENFTLLETPFTARRIKEALGRNIVLLKTRTSVPEGEKILNAILAQK